MNLFLRCLLASLIVHVTFIAFFYRHPLVLHPSLQKWMLKAKMLQKKDEAIANNDELLQEAFSDIVTLSQKSERPFDSQVSPPLFFGEPESEWVETLAFSEGITSSLPGPTAETKRVLLDVNLAIEEPQIEGSMIPDAFISSLNKPNIASAPSIFPIDWVIHSPEEEKKSERIAYRMHPETVDLSPALSARVPSPLAVEGKEIMGRLSPEIDKKQIDPLLLSKSTLVDNALLNRPKMAPRAIGTAESYAIVGAIPEEMWQQDFAFNVHLLRSSEKTGYLFSVTLDPLSNLKDQAMKQEFLFLIDRSNSIDKHRFETYKKAVIKALNVLQPEDTFNVILFDKKIHPLNAKSVLATPKAKLAATRFLEEAKVGDLFAAGELCNLLDPLIKPAASEDQVSTAILLSDGHTALSTKKQQRAITQWMKKNQGQVALYTVTAGENNNLAFLDMLSTLNRGQLLYSDTHASLPRKLAKLVTKIREPIAKDLVIQAVPVDADAKVLFYPPSYRLPALCNNQPYTVFGFIDRFSDFTLLLQGKSEKAWVSLEKKISLQDVKKGPRSLEKKWAQQKAVVCYELFLKEGNVDYLSQAETLLHSSRCLSD